MLELDIDSYCQSGVALCDLNVWSHEVNTYNVGLYTLRGLLCVAYFNHCQSTGSRHLILSGLYFTSINTGKINFSLSIKAIRLYFEQVKQIDISKYKGILGLICFFRQLFFSSVTN